MQIELPPHITVSQFFRLQRERKRVFRDWFDAVYERDWRNGRPKGAGLRDFAIDCVANLEAAGAFDRVEEGAPANLLIKSSRAFEISGKVLWPVGLGQEVERPDAAYAEDALLITRVGASIAHSKVTAYEAPLNLCFTKHALLRLVERGGFQGELQGELSTVLPGLIDAIALTLALGISKNVDGENWSRTAFVPLRGGLLVLTNRIVAAERHNQDIGWRFSFTKRRYSWGYVKRELLQPSQIQGYANIGMWFATTYLSAEQLSRAQASYVATLTSFSEKASRRLRDAAFAIQFDPDYIDDPRKVEAALQDVDEAEFQELYVAVASEAFRVHERDGFAFLIESDTTSRAFRSMLKQVR